MTPAQKAEVERIKKLPFNHPSHFLTTRQARLVVAALAEAEGERDRLAEWKASALAAGRIGVKG